MERRGSFQSKLLVVFFAIFLTVAFVVGISTAIKLQTKYYLGENVKIDLSGLGEYKLKLTTPSTSYFTHGNDTSFSFKPAELGRYNVKIYTSNGEKDYSFDVVEKNSGATPTANSNQGSVLEDFSSEIDSKAMAEPTPSVETNISEEIGNLTADFSINEHAKWNLNLSNGEKVRIPKRGFNVSAHTADDESLKITSKNSTTTQEITVENPTSAPFELEYYTEGPKAKEIVESDNKKQIEVYSEDGVNYSNVLVYTNVSELDNGAGVEVYWEEGDQFLEVQTNDTDNDGKIDYVSWISPDSNNQTFTIIVITKAEHLDANRSFLSDIYETVRAQDGIWSEVINDGEYVRVTFESNLTNKNDITIWPRFVSGNPTVEVYEKDESTLLATFENIQPDKYNQIFLTALQNPQDTFDLKIVGGFVQFDHIIDPTLFYHQYYNIYANVSSTTMGQPPAFGEGWTGPNASQSCYTNMTSIDNNVCKLLSTVANLDQFLNVNVTLTEPTSMIQFINVTVRGNASSSGAAEDLNIYIANFSTGTWSSIGSTKAMANFTLTINSNFADYIRNQRLSLLFSGADMDNGEGIGVDYVNVTVKTIFPRIVNITYPQNATYYNQNISDINYTFLSDGYCWYSTNNWVTNSSAVSCGTNFTNVLVSEGVNRWFIAINDSFGNLNMTSNVTFSRITDTQAPTANYSTLTDANDSILIRKNIRINVTATDTNGISRINITLYNSTRQLINSSFGSTSPLFANFSVRTDGTYYFNATVNDSAGNIYYLETWQVNVSTVPPEIYFVNPTPANNSYKTLGYFEVNVTAFDFDGLSNITINLYNSTRQLINSSFNVASPVYANFSGLTSGLYYYNATAYDYAGNRNITQTRQILFDLRKPSFDIGLTAMSNDTYVAAWTSGNRIAFEILNTSGETLVETVQVSANGSATSRVSVSALNNTHFVVGWYDSFNNNVYYQFFNLSGNNVTNAISPDATGGTGTRISLASFGSSFEYCFVDDGANDFLARTIYTSTLGLGTLISVDNNIGATNAPTFGQQVDCTPINATHFVAAYFDNNANNMRFIVMNRSGVVATSAPILDASVTANGLIAASALNSNKMLVAWEDFTGTDAGSLEYSIVYINGTIIANDSFVEANVGTTGVTANSRLRVATLSSPSSSNDVFLLAWNDQNKSAIRAQIVESNGTISYGPYNLATDENTSTLIFDVYGKNPVTNVSLCRSKYALAYTNLTGSLNTKLFNIDGTPWDGVCDFADLTPPDITLVAPDNASSVSDGFDLNFIYNVTDTSIVDTCSIYIDDVLKQTAYGIIKNTNLSFSQYASQGTHNWSIQCTDSLGNAGFSENRTINVALTQSAFTTRLYETYTSDYLANTIASIRLNNTRDAVQNSVQFQISPLTNEIISKAYTSFMGNNGGFIRAGTPVVFSSSFSAANANIRLTRKLYIVNSTGNYLICQLGNDAALGTQLSTATLTTTNSTCISSNIRLQTSDRLMFQTHGYNTNAGTQSVTHVWDASTSSYIDVNLTTEGFLNTNLSAPLVDQELVTGQQINLSCTVYCTVGICRNTVVYFQYNTSSTNWTNISASGNIILAAGQTNPRTLGNITTTPSMTNTTIRANLNSTNSVRCVALSSYDVMISPNELAINITLSNNPPGLSLQSPPNVSWFNSTNVTFVYNISDINNNIANSSLYIDGVFNRTNATTIINGGLNNFTLNFTNGLHNWTVNATDETNLNGGANITRFFYIDTLRPVINLTGPIPNQTFNTGNILFNFTATDNLDTLLICNLTIDSVVVNASIAAANGSMINITQTGLSAGFHLWNVSCIDEAGNRNTSLSRNFTIGNTPPTVTLVTANNSNFNTSTVILFYNATDNIRIDATLLYINGLVNISNQTRVQNANISHFTINLPDGSYTWSVNATDNGGLNTSSVTYRFLVDSNPPQIALNLPTNLSSSNTSSVNFSFMVTDTLSTTLMCNLTAGEKQDLNFNVTNGTLVNRTLAGFTDGLKIWNVTCIDSSGNRNISETRIVNVTVYPTISLQTANNTVFNTTTFNLSYTPTDNTNFSAAILYINGNANISNQTTIRNGLSNNFTLSNFAEGNYNWSVRVNDTYGLVNNSEIRFFSVDVTSPAIVLSSPTDGETLTTIVTLFNFTVTDNVATNLSCNVTINSVVMNSTYALSANLTSAAVTFTEGGDYLWNVTCVDNAGNRNTSATRSFVLSFPPKVNITGPASGYISNSSTIALFYNVTDINNNIANATLYLNGLENISNQTTIINAQINNFTITLPDGYYNWSVSSTDTTNLVGNSTARNFTIDSTPPTIILNSPVNGTLFTWNNLSINFSVVDNLDTALNCSLLIDGITEVTDLLVNNGTGFSRTVPLIKSDGVYNYSVACFDDGYNINFSQTRVFTVLAPPNVTLMSPRNNSILNSTTLSFIYLPQDAIGFTNCSLYLDGMMNTSSDIITSNVNNTFNVGGLSEGYHNWTVSCTDAFPDFNVFTANVSNFTVDITKPTILLSSPPNNTNTLRSVAFNFTATDNFDLNLTCNLYIDSNLNRTNFSALNGSVTSLNVIGISTGQHTWNVSCFDDTLNSNVSALWLFNVTLPDFYVNYSTITFNNTSPRENEANSINATIYNLNNVSVPNVTVQFFLGNPQTTGVQIGNNITLLNFNGSSSRVVQANISSSGIGYSNIFVVVDPLVATNGQIEELNESNNVANNTVIVSAWQFMYGYMNPDNEFILRNNNSAGISNWAASTFSSANVYVSDYDSTIFWTNLKAIGKSITDTNTSNDFADIDTLLNMTGLTDSILQIYTNSTGVNFSTDNFMIFQKSVPSVPIANSINNSNFKTGILWDTTKNTNSEFDTANKEDLVFITKVNQNAQGAYGTYDYEIRIPAKLRTYYTADSSKVSFYSEIN